jgi:cell division transport system permease protein
MNNTTAPKKARRGYNPFYFVLEALRSFWRNRVMGIASIFVLTSCLILVGAFGLLIHNIDINLDKIGSLNEIVIFLEYDLTEDQVNTIGSDIQKLENVSHVELISKSQGFAEMKETYPEYAELFAEMEKRDDNPLSDSFIVSYIDAETVHDLEYTLQSIPGVRTVNNRLDYTVTIANLKNVVSIVFVWFFVLLLAVSIFVIFNTIKLAVHGRKAEISIMRHIGATKGFIITPFIIEGVMIGLISSIVAFTTDTIIYAVLVKKGAESFKMLELVEPGLVNIIMLLAFLAIGIITGALASVLSLRKNLHH